MNTIKTHRKSTLKINFIISLLFVFVVAGCSKDDGPGTKEIVKSNEKQITSFVFLTIDNPLQIDAVATIDEENKTIIVNVPPDADISNLLPEIKISKAATINPNTAQNFAQIINYTVTAEDGTTATYMVTVRASSTQKIALEAIIDDNPDHTLDWDISNTSNSDLGNLDGVETDGEGNITGLFLMSKNIKVVSPEIALLSHLELLNLDGNPIKTLPPEIGQLTALIGISLIGNQLTSIPVEIGLLTNLEELLIENNPITTLPPEIGQLTKLRRLDLEGNQITSLPPEMAFLTNLEFLFLDESNLGLLPLSIAQLTFYHNLLISASDVLYGVVSQKDALISIFSANPGNTLGWGVANYPEVTFDADGMPKSITMNNKDLTRIPSTIGELNVLEVLNVNGNNLESLPTTLGNINSLTSITAANNNLNTVPSELGQLTNLALLSLTQNPITSIPQEVCDLQANGILTLLTDSGEGCN